MKLYKFDIIAHSFHDAHILIQIPTICIFIFLLIVNIIICIILVIPASIIRFLIICKINMIHIYYHYKINKELINIPNEIIKIIIKYEYHEFFDKHSLIKCNCYLCKYILKIKI